MHDVPLLILMATIWACGVGVGVMAFRVRRKNVKPAWLVPEERFERLLWLIWVPVITAQNVLPLLAIRRRHPLLAVPEVALLHPVVSSLRWAASICAVLCFLVTVECWARMGGNWRIGVVPNQRSDLVTGGLYARIRHPIYAFNALLMLCAAVIVPTIPMMTVTVVHVTLLILKARNEERFLLEEHGERYAEYRRRTGGFFPRLLSRNS
jgi:protein-S-isoprenylcysteine O-methyltransferase Ste14